MVTKSTNGSEAAIPNPIRIIFDRSFTISEGDVSHSCIQETKKNNTAAAMYTTVIINKAFGASIMAGVAERMHMNKMAEAMYGKN